MIVNDGEKAKTMATLGKVHDALVARGVDRKAVLVVVGGGVIGDLAGFAAASYLRGIRLVHVPTTVVAQTDSAIGGKVGVNHRLGKNLLGAFHQPALVAVDPAVLATLSRRELRAGLYEVVKYGVIASAPLFARCASHMDALLDGSPDALLPVITECCAIKADVVTKDEREDGLRRILNFGHTIGHALEAVTQYQAAPPWGSRRLRDEGGVGHRGRPRHVDGGRACHARAPPRSHGSPPGHRRPRCRGRHRRDPP